MPGPLPKSYKLKTRQRKPMAILPAEERPLKQAPRLFNRPEGWRDETKKWWSDVWHSPMASEFLRADVHPLYVVAVLVDAFYQKPTASLAAEIRLQCREFGIGGPLSRRRLEWETLKVDEATDKREINRSKRAKIINDPREVLEND